MNKLAKWIRVEKGIKIDKLSPQFIKNIILDKKVIRAIAKASAIGAYNLYINGQKVGNAVLAPGFTSYPSRVLYQTYDIKDMLSLGNNDIGILCGRAWAAGAFDHGGAAKESFFDHMSVIASIEIEYDDGTEDIIFTDESWDCYTSHILFSELYHGETVDMTSKIEFIGKAAEDTEPKPMLEAQRHGYITEQERISVKEAIKTPKGEKVLDFGQNLVGYVEIKIKGNRGDRIVLSHAEVLDREGNFYTENMRKAKNLNTYILSGGEDIFKPTFSFQGFRYVRLDECPENISIEDFNAIVIHTDMKRTGHFICGDKKINQLYSNIIWGQKGNYVDIPTDCPQRDERQGWTADTQVFCRTGAINYDVEDFFDKWLCDMSLEQSESGAIYRIVPYYQRKLGGRISAGWSDAACVVPWEIYRAYGNREILEKYYPMMTKWVDYIRNFGDEEYLWIGGDHYGDWLAMDAGDGALYGATQTDLIASAYFAYSTSLVIKAGSILGYDVSEYVELLKNIKKAFRAAFIKDGLPVIYPKADAFDIRRPVKADTQTACAMILKFDLCEEHEREALAAHLVKLIKQSDGLMTTGFLGTPILLHVLAENGYYDVAYSLLFEERSPSWLFSVNQGATTVWEHWDGIKADGSFWSDSMNSFNHYAYGCVFDWIFEYAGGISVCDDGAGYTHVSICPCPDRRLGFVDIGIETRHGELSVKWKYDGDTVIYDICVPNGTVADICIGDKAQAVSGGKYRFYERA